MKLYEYWLGLYPLDWEFCFMPVQTYKNFITEQYHKNPTFYNISAGSIEKVLAHIDVILSAAMEDWNNTTNHAALRCPPMIFPLPKGQDSNTAEFAIILKMDNDGDTVVYSPIPLALDLIPGDYGRAVCNGRFRDWDTGIWYYALDILNVMPLTELTDSLTSFTDREPSKIYTKIDRLW